MKIQKCFLHNLIVEHVAEQSYHANETANTDCKNSCSPSWETWPVPFNDPDFLNLAQGKKHDLREFCCTPSRFIFPFCFIASASVHPHWWARRNKLHSVLYWVRTVPTQVWFLGCASLSAKSFGFLSVLSTNRSEASHWKLKRSKSSDAGSYHKNSQTLG